MLLVYDGAATEAADAEATRPKARAIMEVNCILAVVVCCLLVGIKLKLL